VEECIRFELTSENWLQGHSLKGLYQLFPSEKTFLIPYKGPLEISGIFGPDIGICPPRFADPPFEHTSTNLDKIDDNVEVVGVVAEDEKIAEGLDHHQGSGKKEDVDYPASKGTFGSHSPCIPASSFLLELLRVHPRIGSENNHPLNKKKYDSY
jgi:hypothetical protein